MTFIKKLLDHMADVESPNSYITWSGLSIISAILRDQVYFQFKHGRIYPNIYVIIVAGSSATRKDAPVRIAEKLIREVGNTKIITGRASIQGVMRTLADNYTNEAGHRLKGASGILLSKELSDLIVEDPVAMKVLTDWYDCHDIWENNLISLGGVSKLENVCVTLLAASNDVLFQDVFKHAEVYGGLLARSFIITENKRKRKNSRMYDPVGEEDLYPVLVKHLKTLVSLKGAIKFTDDARKYYDDWYNNIEDEKFDRAGVIARMHTGVLKVSMLLAAARIDFGMTVHQEDIEGAIDLCTDLMKNYKRLTVVSGKSDLANPMNLILTELLKAPQYTLQRRFLIQRLLGSLDTELLDKSVVTLIDAQYLTVTQQGGSAAYKLTSMFLEQYSEEVKSKAKGVAK